MVDAVMSKGGRALLAHQWHQAKSNFTPAIALLLSERQTVSGWCDRYVPFPVL